MFCQGRCETFVIEARGAVPLGDQRHHTPHTHLRCPNHSSPQTGLSASLHNTVDRQNLTKQTHTSHCCRQQRKKERQRSKLHPTKNVLLCPPPCVLPVSPNHHQLRERERSKRKDSRCLGEQGKLHARSFNKARQPFSFLCSEHKTSKGQPQPTQACLCACYCCCLSS